MERINVIDCFKKKYIIPCFQREYSWEEEEIEELIKNIKSLKEDEHYCIGIVTVKKKNDSNVLIDGQQRITTLYLMAIYCGLLTKKEEIMLTSEYEGLISNRNYLVDLLLGKEENVPKKIVDGLITIKKNIAENEIDSFKKVIKNLYYYEVDLDDNIDLNHYFEVMNSRGVQLSRSDIIKSYLMNKLDNDEDMNKLNNLWYKYEKMSDRNTPFVNFKDVPQKIKNDYRSISKILEDDNIDVPNEETDFNKTDNDSTILNFEYFLLYIIRIYKDIDNDDLSVSGEFHLTDLIDEYEDYFDNQKNAQDVIEFLDFMISMKNIYDNYIVRYDNKTETWSLEQSEDMLFIQSCLRVSFVNRRLMHWVYMTLKYFYKNKDVNKYITIMRNYIREKYVKDYLEKFKSVNYRSGFDTPVIILNYLDLLIKENYDMVVSDIPEARGLSIKDFKFKFRNSLEHFKPRHDAEGNENPAWVDDFGNLALLAYGTNTKMQNADPDEKADHFGKELFGYSLKLQIMSKMALINKNWDDVMSYKVKDLMIKLLSDDLQIV